MNLPDLVVNCLDTTTFFLVTPELIGRERLEVLQSWLRQRSWLISLALAVVLATIYVITATSFFHHFLEPYFSSTSVRGRFVELGLVTAVFGSIGCFLGYIGPRVIRALIRRQSLTRMMLAVGCLMFLVARGIAIWHAAFAAP